MRRCEIVIPVLIIRIAVRRIETVAIHFVLFEPVLECTFEHRVRGSKTMIPVLIDVVRVRRGDIEPRVLCEVGTVRIQLVHRVETRRVVQHHIQNDGNAAFVTLVNERLDLLLRAVSAVRCKIMVRRVAPVVVSVELTDRHQLDSVNA